MSAQLASPAYSRIPRYDPTVQLRAPDETFTQAIARKGLKVPKPTSPRQWVAAQCRIMQPKRRFPVLGKISGATFTPFTFTSFTDDGQFSSAESTAAYVAEYCKMNCLKVAA